MIDFHVHAGQFDLLRDDIQGLLTKRPFEPGFDLRAVFSSPVELEKYLRSYGVERAVVLAECGPGTNFTIDSEMIARFAANSPFFVPFGSINPNHHEVPAEFAKSLQVGVRGFKFYPADHGFDPYVQEMMKVYGECQERGLPVMFHTGKTGQRGVEPKFIQPEEFERIARSFPKLTLILAHCGRPSWYQSARSLALELENVYLDTALVEPVDLRREYGDLRDLRHKLIFGSDWPVAGSYAVLMQKLEEARITPDIADDLLRNNARRIIDAIPAAA